MLAWASISFLCTCLAAKLVFGQPLPLPGAITTWCVLTLLVIALQAAARRGYDWAGVALTASLWSLVAVCNSGLEVIKLKQYGDHGALETFISAGQVFPRWLLGTEILRHIYTVSGSTDARLFVAVLGAGVLWGCTLIALRWSKLSIACLSVVYMPLWSMFLSGYSEYYPFIAGPLLLLLVWLVQSAERRVSPLALGIICALFTALYFGYLPLGAALLLLIGKQSRTDRIIGMAVFAMVSALIVPTLWEGGWPGYINALNLEIDPSGMNIIPAYRSHRWHASFLFEPTFLLTPLHLSHKLYIFFFTGGVALLGVAAVNWKILKRSALWPRERASRALLWLVLMELGYFCLAIPYFGPRRDIDLFFQVLIVFGFAAGHLLERSAPAERLPEIRTTAMGVLLGSCAALTWFLVFVGIPRLSGGLPTSLLSGFSFK